MGFFRTNHMLFCPPAVPPDPLGQIDPPMGKDGLLHSPRAFNGAGQIHSPVEFTAIWASRQPHTPGVTILENGLQTQAPVDVVLNMAEHMQVLLTGIFPSPQAAHADPTIP
jgi:hypothetical protein